MQLAHTVAVLLLVSFGTFGMLDLLPGDPAHALLGEYATPDQVAALRHELQLDRPFPVRYLSWLTKVVHGDLGTSVRTGQSTIRAVTERIPTSVELVLLAQFLALLIAVPAALYAAARPRGPTDRLASASAFALISAPSFMLAVLFILVFAVRLGWFPATGWTPISESVPKNLRSALLPSLALSLAGPTPTYFRVLRADLTSTLRQDFVALARAKGISNWRVLSRHALRPSSFSLITLTGDQIGRMLGGTVIVESLFALPGLGRLITTSISSRDLIVLQGAVLLIASSHVLINRFVDIAYRLLDPRVSTHG